MCHLEIFYFIHFNFCFQVRDLVEKCTCPSQFPMVRVSEGKYRIGDTKVLIFVRVSEKNVKFGQKCKDSPNVKLISILCYSFQ